MISGLRLTYFFVGGFCLISLHACTGPQQPTNVAAATLIPAPSEVTCLGRIVPGDGIVKAAAPPSSIVSDLKVQRGDHVSKGQILAILNDYPQAVAALQEATVQVSVASVVVDQAQAPEKPAALSAQEAAIARQQLILQNAEADHQRRAQLFADHLISDSDFAATELNLQTARESLRREMEVLSGQKQVRTVDVELARQRLAAAIAARKKALVDVERQIIRAPFAASVLQIYARAGESPGASGILDLGDTSQMFIEAEVYATDIRHVRQGAVASATGEAFEGVVTGRVAEILPEAGYNALFPPDPSNAADKRIVPVRIRLDDGRKVHALNNSQVLVRIRL